MGPNGGLLNADECASAGVDEIHIREDQCCKSQRIFHTHTRRIESLPMLIRPNSDGDAASSVSPVKHIYNVGLLYWDAQHF